MYGYCEDFQDAFREGEHIVAHTLLKRFKFYKTCEDAQEVLNKQIIKNKTDEIEDQLVSDEQILRFLAKHSKYGKNIKEIELVQETLSHL